MAAKKANNKKTARAARPKREEQDPATDAVHAMLEMISSHDATIRKLAEVVVNLHANVRALRDVVEPLGSRVIDESVARPLRALRRVTLDE